MKNSETTEPTPAAKLSAIRRLQEKYEARIAWEAENDRHQLCACHMRTLTAAWKEALLDDHIWTETHEKAEAERRAANVLPLRLRAAGVAPIHADAIFSGLEDRPPLIAVRKYLSQPVPKPKPWLLLMGPTDAGKSQAAAVVVADYLRAYPWNESATGMEGRPVARRVRAPELNEVDAFSEQGRKWLESLREARLLVVDDLGTERLNEVVLTNLYGILDARYESRRPTILTTNLKVRRAKPTDPPQWAERYDERFTRRVRELAMVFRDGRIQEGEQ